MLDFVVQLAKSFGFSLRYAEDNYVVVEATSTELPKSTSSSGCVPWGPKHPTFHIALRDSAISVIRESVWQFDKDKNKQRPVYTLSKEATVIIPCAAPNFEELLRQAMYG